MTDSVQITVTDDQPIIVKIGGRDGLPGPPGPGVDSYLTATIDADVSGSIPHFPHAASSVADGSFTLADPGGLSGTDLEIDGGDATKINVLTDGVYQVVASLLVYADGDAFTAGDSASAFLGGTILGVASTWNLGNDSNRPFVYQGAGFVNSQPIFTSEPRALQAGDVISLSATNQPQGDMAWAFAWGAISVVKLS